MKRNAKIDQAELHSILSFNLTEEDRSSKRKVKTDSD
jgi:hypothetical protein